jgi:putative ABC transport system permease protein
MTRAEFHENLMVALDTLRMHKVRSGLTVLGIVIGVTSVISVAAIIQGLNGFVARRVEQMGSRTYMVSRFSMSSGFGRVPEKIRKRKYLDPDYAKALRESCPSLETVTPFTGRPMSPGAFGPEQANEITYGSERVERIILRAFEPEIAGAIPLFSIAHGRPFLQYDLDHSREVVILGDAIANSLFPSLDPISKTVRVNGRLMEVIGVFDQDPGLFGGPGVDQIVAMPLTTFRKHFPEQKEFLIAFTFGANVRPETATGEVVEALRRIRRLPHSQENDFEIFSPDFLTSLWNQLTGALVLLTAAISSIGLLIGGIGVMNIMLISVTERTAEIGVRKAMGARNADIRAQFLMEAIVISLAGGALGILCGAVISFLVASLIPNVPATLSYFWASAGVLISVGVGLFFGYYPASRAASLDPVVCLRYE